MPSNAPAVRRLRSDGQATRQRLVDAATVEFATYGNAGARIERIADSAAINKSQVYAYFDGKHALFDAVLRRATAAIVDAAPFDARDLAGYAVLLYDAYLARPDMLRLAAWNRLERRPVGDLFADVEPLDQIKRDAIVEAQRDGQVNANIAPDDVHALVIAMATTWSAVSLTVAASHHEAPSAHARRRESLAVAVRGAVRP